MYNSSTLKILSSFDKDEFKRFEDFICSPFFNKKKNLTALFSELKKYYPGFESRDLKSEMLWERIFPGKNYNYGIMKNLVYDLHKITENFLQYLQFESNEIGRTNLLLKEFSERNLLKHFEKEAKRNAAALKKSKRDAAYYQNNLNFQILRRTFLYTKKLGKERLQDIHELNRALLEFFFIYFFDTNYHAVLAIDVLNTDYDSELINTVIKFFDSSPLKVSDDELVFYLFVKLAMERDDINGFYKIKSLIEKNYSGFSKELQYVFYIRLCDFCTRRILNETKFSKELYEICRSMLDKKLYTDGKNKYMTYNLYLCISESALMCNEAEWAKKFIEEYKERLDPEFRELFYQKAMISYFFVNGEFGSALELLSKIKITAQTDKLSIKQFQAMCYYEMDYLEELELLIDSSRHFISLDKNISPEKARKFLGFFHIMKKLIGLRSKKEFKEDLNVEIGQLHQEIHSKRYSHGIWLTKKLDELK